MNQPLVSILLPTYKDARHLRRAIESVLMQTHKNWELIIIDDGLSREPLEIVREYKEKDQRIFHLKNENNLGIQKSLNVGLASAKGKYIARIDDDDEWIDAEKLEKQARFLEENQEYVLVGTNAQIVDEEGKVLATYAMPSDDASLRNRMLSKNCFIHSSIVALKSATEKVGKYDETENSRHIEDYDLWLRLGKIGKLQNLRFVGVRIMIHENSLTSKNRVLQARRMFSLIGKYKNSYPRFLLSKKILLLRIISFTLLKFLPIPDKILYKIQKIYKGI